MSWGFDNSSTLTEKVQTITQRIFQQLFLYFDNNVLMQFVVCYCSEEPDHLVVESLGSVVGLVVIHEGGEVQLAGHLLGFLTSQPRPDNSLSQGRIELGDISLDFIVSFLNMNFLLHLIFFKFIQLQVEHY